MHPETATQAATEPIADFWGDNSVQVVSACRIGYNAVR